jgi:hypothetical protein
MSESVPNLGKPTMILPRGSDPNQEVEFNPSFIEWLVEFVKASKGMNYTNFNYDMILEEETALKLGDKARLKTEVRKRLKMWADRMKHMMRKSPKNILKLDTRDFIYASGAAPPGHMQSDQRGGPLGPLSSEDDVPLIEESQVIPADSVSGDSIRSISPPSESADTAVGHRSAVELHEWVRAQRAWAGEAGAVSDCQCRRCTAADYMRDDIPLPWDQVRILKAYYNRVNPVRGLTDKQISQILTANTESYRVRKELSGMNIRELQSRAVAEGVVVDSDDPEKLIDLVVARFDNPSQDRVDWINLVKKLESKFKVDVSLFRGGKRRPKSIKTHRTKKRRSYKKKRRSSKKKKKKKTRRKRR